MTGSISPSCLSTKELTSYARDEMDTSVSSAYDRHLSQCPLCRDRYIDALGGQLLVPDVPNCRVVKEIGRGRFGVVYKAWWLGDAPKLVALKVLNSVGEMERLRFEREVAVLQRLDAPGVVKCHDAGGSGESAYFIMDFVEGVHFDEYVRDESRSLDDKLAVFEKVCRVVALAHRHGVIHRDLKPRNILIDKTGQPHVLDFGICSVDSLDKSSWALGTLTHPGDVIGTLRYMSPEQAWGGVAGPIDERSDIWSLGIILYELVTDGDYPYSLEPMPDRTPHESLLERIRKEMPRSPRLNSLPRGRDLETLLERCLAWDPNERLRSASVLADDVAAHRQERRISTRPFSIPRRIRRLAVGAATRSRWTFAASFVALVMATLSIAAMIRAISWTEPVSVGPQRADRSAAPSQSDPRDGIVVVGVFDDSAAAVLDYASDAGVTGVTDDVRTWRGIHARMMKRMVTARPRTVVWDYHFTSEQPDDSLLADAILALDRVGVPVVLASGAYDVHGAPVLSPELIRRIGPALRHGSIETRSQTRRPGEFVVVVQRDGGIVIPSLWLTTLAAVLHPEAQIDVEWHDRLQSPTLMYAVGPGLYRRERDELQLSKVYALASEADGSRSGDLIGSMRMDMADPRSWHLRTTPYEWLLRCSDQELTEAVRDKVVLFGDLRTAHAGFVADRHDVDFAGQTLPEVPGSYLVAEATAGLLSREYIRAPFPLPTSLMLLVLGLSVAGCLIPLRVALWRQLESLKRRRGLLVALSLACSLSFVLALSGASAVAVWTSIAVFSLSSPLVGSFWVEFVRNRHRVAERERRVIEGFGFESAGTLTLPRQRLTSIPEIR